MYREKDPADGIYFIKEGEFEISKSHKVTLDKGLAKFTGRLLKTQELKVSIIGKNQVIGLDDLSKDQDTFRS